MEDNEKVPDLDNLEVSELEDENLDEVAGGTVGPQTINVNCPC